MFLFLLKKKEMTVGSCCFQDISLWFRNWMPFIYSQRLLGMEAEEFLILVVHNINKKIIILNDYFPTIKMKKSWKMLVRRIQQDRITEGMERVLWKVWQSVSTAWWSKSLSLSLSLLHGLTEKLWETSSIFPKSPLASTSSSQLWLYFCNWMFKVCFKP